MKESRFTQRKKYSKERYSTNFSSSHPEVYSKRGVLKTGGISPKILDFITFKTCDKTRSKIEKAWFLLLQWVAKGSKMNGKMFILIYLSNN